MSANSRPNRAARRVLLAAAGLTTVGALVAAMPAAAHGGSGNGHGNGGPGSGNGRTVDVQLLSLNDLHGNLEPPAGSSGKVGTVDAGGVEHLATSLRKARAGKEYSVTAAAGDMIGGSPMLSGLFHDEPTVEALNKMKLDVTSVGNHEFDEGSAELLRIQNGGCHPTEGCYEKDWKGKPKKFQGADFPYLSANVTKERSGRTLLKPYTVWKKNGVKIGFIGVTLENTPGIVTAAGVKGLKFHDEIETVNKYAKELDRQGVKSIVALIHEGGAPASSTYDYNCDSPGPGDGVSGPIKDIAKGISPKVDALVTGHTHQSYVCNIPDPAGNPRLVTSAASFGKVYTETTLTYDRRTKDIVRTAAKSPSSRNHIVTRDQPEAKKLGKDMRSLIERWNVLAAPIANRPQGFISADINGRGSTELEKPLGSLIADAQQQGLSAADKGGAQLALMNPGGIRSDLVFKASGAEGDGVVTYGEAFTVQPFTNLMNVVDLTGADLIAALKQQVSGGNEASPKILQISKGLTYTLDLTKTGADRIDAATIKLNGEAIDPAKTYRVAMNEFLAGGGDNFPALALGKNKLNAASDLDVFNAYLAANSTADKPITPPAAGRINIVK
ncbi:bifunctional metallophosphatase/5'-nucleotidase [Streptomyces sp. NPDC051561]|uniref:bifunctional metallophosphatase/5'-nucleotidase n=1 Tax=Streptomyces sp. NPDC051561 TaxID=3365658 RepID=UPI0037879DFA